MIIVKRSGCETMDILYMAYQPIHNINGVYGYESLVRGSESRNIINIFSDSRENKRSLIQSLDENLKRKSIAEITLLDHEKLFINSHPYSDVIVPWRWEETPIRPEQTVIELTEHVILNDDIVAEIHHLKNIGVEFAIDDFGVGFFDLSLIKSIAPNYIKIAKEMTADIHTDTRSKNMFAHLTDFCGKFHCPVIAEGIETKEQYETAKNYCQYFQGYYFGRPEPKNKPILKRTNSL